MLTLLSARCYMLQLAPQTDSQKHFTLSQSSTAHGGDTHHNIHRLSSIFVLDDHGVSARVLQRNAFDGQTGKPALVQRHHVLEH